jgi:ribosome-binding protein aMBF1 (putative translation factor)
MTGKDFQLAVQKMGITQRQFAELVGVKENTISRYSTGRLKVPLKIEALINEMEKNKKVIAMIARGESWVDEVHAAFEKQYGIKISTSSETRSVLQILQILKMIVGD